MRQRLTRVIVWHTESLAKSTEDKEAIITEVMAMVMSRLPMKRASTTGRDIAMELISQMTSLMATKTRTSMTRMRRALISTRVMAALMKTASQTTVLTTTMTMMTIKVPYDGQAMWDGGHMRPTGMGLIERLSNGMLFHA